MADNYTDKIIEAINRGMGDNLAGKLSQGVSSDVKTVIPTGLAVLDHWVLGCGGWPCGRIVELFAEQAAGKTSLGYAALASAQKLDFPSYLIETEFATESERPRVFGADPDRIIIMQPGHWDAAQEALEAVLGTHPDSMPGVLVFDSVAGTPTKEEIDEGPSKGSGYDKRAKMLSQLMRTLSGSIAQKNLVAIFINQVRSNMNSFSGPVTPGGYALKFHASVRLCLWAAKKKEVGGVIVGNEVTIKAEKNKIGPPHRKARVMLNYAAGWDDDWSTLKAAREAGLVANNARDAGKARELLDANGWQLGKGNAADAD